MREYTVLPGSIVGQLRGLLITQRNGVIKALLSFWSFCYTIHKSVYPEGNCSAQNPSASLIPSKWREWVISPSIEYVLSGCQGCSCANKSGQGQGPISQGKPSNGFIPRSWTAFLNTIRVPLERRKGEIDLGWAGNRDNYSPPNCIASQWKKMVNDHVA